MHLERSTPASYPGFVEGTLYRTETPNRIEPMIAQVPKPGVTERSVIGRSAGAQGGAQTSPMVETHGKVPAQYDQRWHDAWQAGVPPGRVSLHLIHSPEAFVKSAVHNLGGLVARPPMPTDNGLWIWRFRSRSRKYGQVWHIA